MPIDTLTQDEKDAQAAAIIADYHAYAAHHQRQYDADMQPVHGAYDVSEAAAQAKLVAATAERKAEVNAQLAALGYALI